MWKSDPAVNIDPGYVHALWPEVARQRLRQSALAKLPDPNAIDL
jgi:hypothetical protein